MLRNFILFFIFFFSCCINAQELVEAYVNYENGVYNISFSPNPKIQPARGFFNDTIMSTGWSTLKIYTSTVFDDEIQAYAAGFLEGYLTRERIYHHAHNCFNDTPSAELQEFLKQNDKFIDKNIKENVNDSYWYHISLLVQQYNGLIDGYMKYSDKSLRRWNILSMVLSGDYPDINSAIQNKLNEEDHCSALIKVLPNNEDIIVSQDTWTSFNSMIRIWKIYDFPWKMSKNSKETVPNRIMSFSSYPGYMFSGDDFYLLSGNMVVQETTIGNHNISLNQYIKPNTVYIWMRNMVANRISNSGKEWCKVFEKYNNGCYNNEFMIIDYKLFHPNEELRDGTLYVLEQLPGNIIYDDLTHVLKSQTYFPSYNLPYFSKIKDLMNLDELIKQYGDYYTYENTSRALIFKREHKNIKGLKDMRFLMRYNNYQHDEYSHCNCTPNGYSSSLAIATRGDLNPIDGTYSPPGLGHRNHVATDSKITCYDMIMNHNLSVDIISGPPNNDYNPISPFVWSKSDFKNENHLGQPDKWDFSWYRMDHYGNMKEFK